MMKALKPLAILFYISLTISCANRKVANSAMSSTATVLFFDDFSAPSLDRTKWNVVITGSTVNNEQQAYVDYTSIIYTVRGTKAEGARNGALVIEPVYSAGFTTKEGKKFDFLSGRINTRSRVEFTYGQAAARIKMPGGSGFWPAFWALGNGKWPDSGEIDIMENVGEPDWTSVALHGPGYFGETPLVNKFYFKKNFDATQWHIYSVDWTKDYLVFKIDDDLVYRVTRPMVENYGKWAFDNPKYLIINLALGGAYPYKTNGIKQPYNGIPQSTIDLIKAKKARYMVDWVRVTRNL